MSNEILELSEEVQEKAKPTENVDEAPKVNKDGFVAGQEVDSKSYFEFLAKQRNS